MIRGPRCTASCRPFALDPVADPVGQIADDAGVVDVADGRDGRAGRAPPPPAGTRRGWRSSRKKLTRRLTRRLSVSSYASNSTRSAFDGRRCAPAGSGAPSAARVRSNAATGSGPVSGGAPGAARPGRRGRSPPRSHQRRLPVGRVVGEEQGAAVARAAADRRAAHRPGSPRPSGRSPRAPRAARAGANRSRHSPPTRVSCWLPGAPAELLVEGRDRARRAAAARRAAPRPARSGRSRNVEHSRRTSRILAGVEALQAGTSAP